MISEIVCPPLCAISLSICKVDPYKVMWPSRAAYSMNLVCVATVMISANECAQSGSVHGCGNDIQGLCIRCLFTMHNWNSRPVHILAIHNPQLGVQWSRIVCIATIIIVRNAYATAWLYVCVYVCVYVCMLTSNFPITNWSAVGGIPSHIPIPFGWLAVFV